jgi:transcriptional regulator with XRE-family HTH domain
MKAKNLTGYVLAERAGITKQTFSGYLNKGRTPVCSVIAEWVVEIGINANWILTGVGEMFLDEGSKTTPAATLQTEGTIDPIAQRMETAARLLREADASPELIQQAILAIIESEKHAENQSKNPPFPPSPGC